MTRKLSVRVHDTHVGIWQDDPNDKTFKIEIFDGIIRLLRSRGWKVGRDDDIHRRHRCLTKYHRLASKDNLIASLRISGRAIELDVWAETWAKDNRNGHRYDFDKRPRLDYLDRLRLEVTERTLIGWLETRAEVTVNRSRLLPSSGLITAADFIAADYAESWHKDKALGRPIPQTDDARRSRDGVLLEQGQTVWVTDDKGRILRGAAFFSLNIMWRVVTAPHAMLTVAAYEIYAIEPEDLRQKRNGRARRCRLEKELARALRSDDFRRAAQLRTILFGDQPTFRIWSRKHDAFYGPDYRGYTSDILSAGRYTRAEAEREVRRVPHILHAIGPDGQREDFASEAAA